MSASGLSAYSSAAILDRAFPQHSPRLAFRGRTVEDWAQWRAELLSELRTLLGPFPADRVPLHPQVISEVRYADYTEYKVTYQSRAGVLVPAYLLVPARLSTPRPAVLCVHGHVPGGKESVVRGGHPYGVPYGAELARMGLVTLCPDNAGMGERADARGGCELLWRRLNYLGLDLTGYRAYDLMRGLDYLCSRPEVDPYAIGIAGLSGGCWLALVAAALDERVAAAVLSGYFTTFAQTSWHGHCICHHPKGIGQLCEMPDIAGLIAPRPVFVEWGTEDVERPVHPAYEQTQAIYAVAGAPESVQLHEFAGPHLFSGERSLPWLSTYLSSLTSMGRGAGADAV